MQHILVSYCIFSQTSSLHNLTQSILLAFFNPPEEFKIADKAFEINDISKVKLIGKDNTEEGLMKFFQALENVSRGREVCFIGHNIIQFDMPILEKELQRYDDSCKDLQKYLDNIYVIDTLTMARDDKTWNGLDMDKPASRELVALHEYLFGKELVDSHSAMGDCLGNAKVLLKMDPTLKIAEQRMKKWKKVKQGVSDEDENTEEE